MMKNIILICLFIQFTFIAQTDLDLPSKFNVSWNTPSKDYNGSMPIGNGEIGLNVWVEENGDLLFYIGKTDSWDAYGRLLKVGKIRIKLSPSQKFPLQNFDQTLHLENSTIEIKYNNCKILFWVDANNQVINVEIESSEEISPIASLELWRTSEYQLPKIEISDVMYDHSIQNNQIEPTIVEPDSILNLDNEIGWFHINKKSVGQNFTSLHQGLQNFKRADPLLNRIFGGIVVTENPIKIDNSSIKSKNSTKHRFSIYLLTEHPSTPIKWLENLNSLANKIEGISIKQKFENHSIWWSNFWERSWIDISANNSNPKDMEDAFTVSQTYALQRFINACNGRGEYPIKFNGSIFNVPFKDAPGDADYRRWGPGYWWQNTRLPYYSMPASGDFEMMLPLFKMYAKDNFELFKYRTKLYLDVNGVFIPECIYFWGDLFTESYGATPFENRSDKLQESGWHKWEWVSGLELVYLLLDYFEYTNDVEFLSEYVLPTSNEIITFFDNFYKTENGKLVMQPSQSGETWWKCLNPMPELAGLHSVVNRLLNLKSDKINNEMTDYWKSIKSKLPDLPIHENNGIKMFAPAEKFENKMNIENTELYSVFPFQLVNFNSQNKQLAIDAFKYRLDKGNWGWRQDDIFASYLGLVDTTKKYLVERAKNKNADSRFPAFWGPNYDWTPDQTHGGVLMKTLQSMLIQTEGDKIYILPTWPKEWDVKFRLNAPNKTTIEGNYSKGKFEIINVSPEKRKSDIVIVN